MDPYRKWRPHNLHHEFSGGDFCNWTKVALAVAAASHPSTPNCRFADPPAAPLRVRLGSSLGL